MDKTRILLAEDDPNLGMLLTEYLEVKNFDVTRAQDGEEALRAYQDGDHDLCIFDVMMPKMDGYTLAERIRKSDVDIPIFFLTAKSMKEDTLRGFEVGADDYITKPFSMEELLARITSILRRTKSKTDSKEKQTIFEVGKFTFDFNAQMLRYNDDGSEQRLTSKESALLRLLAIHKNEIMDRSLALKKIWLDDNYFNSRSMDVYITKLRKFLKPDDNLRIVNVHGQGFKLVELGTE
ncbi:MULTISPECIES: response regulator transcription factor [Flammeovirga]|uniref:Response regulator transcription factor n=2 Tax=Flammeovirga TaxID=59739 RepID=A0A3S9NZM5_9BACT|nr:MULTISPECIES: response regulator transcription factor [Flammeovirga]AZQ61370.1 response regulator transcription factor [Flammeovirga pectinis]MBB6459090.1 DNA-binding response OmpR family regulator [Flammeovirga kamogawensis]QWG08659.1 response regulator transcription factor [Flammeovirga kamogawensis]TRX66952.1 response regulator transcription factor [Flammeovirga kamogawensis]